MKFIQWLESQFKQILNRFRFENKITTRKTNRLIATVNQSISEIKHLAPHGSFEYFKIWPLDILYPVEPGEGKLNKKDELNLNHYLREFQLRATISEHSKTIHHIKIFPVKYNN